jgi:IS1 family transposase
MESNNQVKATTFVKEFKKWNVSWETTDKEVVYKKLLDDLISKKVNACRYILRIERVNLYNGYERITVYYDNDVKTDYIIDRGW